MMGAIVDPAGVPIPTPEEQTSSEQRRQTLNTIVNLLAAQNMQIHEVLEAGINIILHAYAHVPSNGERQFINVCMHNLAQAFGQATVEKAALAREAKKAVEALNKAH